MQSSAAEEFLQEGAHVSFSWKLSNEEPPDRSLPDRWADRSAALWAYPVLRSWQARAALLAAIAAICAVRAWAGLAAVRIFAHDAFMPLDGAWRLLNGQRPHLDFYSFVGVLAYAPTAAGLVLSRSGAEGFAYAQAMQGLLLGVWAFLLSRKRLPDVPAALFTLAIVLLAVAPFPLGFSPLQSSPATTYNRYGYAALGLVMLEALSPRKRSEFWGGISTGLLLVLLFFLKISYVAGAMLLIGALILCRAQTRFRWAGMAMGAAVCSLPFFVYFGFHMAPMLRDLAMVGGAKRIHPRAYLFDSILTDAATILGFAAAAALTLFAGKRGRQARIALVAGAAVCLTGLLLIFGNCEPHGMPLTLFFLLIVVSHFDFRTAGLPHLLRGLVLAWVTLFAGASMLPGFLALGYAALSKPGARNEIALASGALRNFVPLSDDYGYQTFANDGIRLLEHHRRPGDTVMSLDFSNPFSYGLGMPPARGGTTALHYQTTFNDRHRPSAEWLFGSARLVMVPKNFSDPTLQESIPRLYGAYLSTHFRLLGESAQWRLYRAAGL